MHDDVVLQEPVPRPLTLQEAASFGTQHWAHVEKGVGEARAEEGQAVSSAAHTTKPPRIT